MKGIAANVVALPELVIGPVKFAFVVTLPAVKLAAVPEQFVNVPLAGVPNTGATNVVPLGKVGVPDKLLAVPDVDWFNVGNVQFVNVPLAGVPNAGVTNVKFVTVPLAFVKTIALGVPKSGVVKVGLVNVLLVNV